MIYTTLNTVLIIALCTLSMIGQTDTSLVVAKDSSVALANTITKEEVATHLSILASDQLEGRETGTKGNWMAAYYIAGQFASFGIPALKKDTAGSGLTQDYFQYVSFTWTRWDDLTLIVRGKEYKHLWDFISFPTKNRSDSLVTDEVWFAGYGIESENYSDYEGWEAKDKVLLIYEGEPVNDEGVSMVTGTDSLSDWDGNTAKKLRLAREKGARLVLVIEDDIKAAVQKNRRFLLGPRVKLGDEPQHTDQVNAIYISSSVAKRLMGDRLKKVVRSRDKMKQKGDSRWVKIPTKLAIKQKLSRNTVKSANVLGYIEGSDPEKKDKLIVVTAHYDHLGKRGQSIFNGADDNGSGTSAVIEIAEALAIAKQRGIGPKRSVLCMLVTGEEKGLLGSAYYAKHPVFPLDSTIANVNVDMIGRIDDKHDRSDYIYVIGADRLSTELHEINEKMNRKYTDLQLDYTYNEKDDPNRFYYRSDHYNFAKNGIPAIFYFSGTHDDYHRPSDTVDKIMFNKIEPIAKLIFHTVWDLANREDQIEVDVPQIQRD